MNIYGIEQGLGAAYGAKRICCDEEVYGIGIIKIDDEKSYLIQLFQTDDFTDGVPAQAYYVAVRTDSIFLLSKDETLLEEDNFNNKTSQDPVKSLKKINYNFGQRLVSPIIDD